jgi:hypothetical protein
MVRDTLLYTSQGFSGFFIGDISDPTDPLYVSSVEFERVIAMDFALYGNMAYVGAYDFYPQPQEISLYSVDISNASDPVVVDSIFLGSAQPSVSTAGARLAKRSDHLYVAGRGVGVVCVDISNPGLPDVVSVYSSEDEDYRDIAWRRQYLFAVGIHSIQVFDISNPSDIQLIQFVPFPADARRLDVQDDYLYVTGSWGFYIYDINLPPVDCGDANASGEVDIDDVVYLIAYIFSGGPGPDPSEAADVDCSGGVDIDDVVYLIMYIFAGGPVPCEGC